MPNLGSVLKSEIIRLARKEARLQIEPLKTSNGVLRRDVAELKRQVAVLQREHKGQKKAAAVAPATEATKARFSAKGLRSLRARLGLSAADFGKLAGASAQSIYNWETGKAVPRAKQADALASLRTLGKRAALARLQTGP
jgi:DNA-binding transcriptional regulator YiaG